MSERTSRMTMSLASFEEAARAAASAFSIESLPGSASPSLPSLFCSCPVSCPADSLSNEVGSEYHRHVDPVGLWGLRGVLPRHRDGPRTQGFRRLPPDPLRGLRARVNDDPGRG